MHYSISFFVFLYLPRGEGFIVYEKVVVTKGIFLQPLPHSRGKLMEKHEMDLPQEWSWVADVRITIGHPKLKCAVFQPISFYIQYLWGTY